MPQLGQFAPDLVMISAGFDAHKDDPLGGLRLDEADYIWVTEQLTGFAERYCGGRLVSTLEGGYDLDALAASTAAHVAVLMAA
jgi:acetoin utilization deacetylase AcuC-like enzyme